MISPTSMSPRTAGTARLLSVRQLSLGASVLGLLALSSCAQETHCSPLADCGGPFPEGDWRLGQNGSACQEDLYVPPRDERLAGRDIVARRLPIPEESFNDWCGGLVLGQMDVTSQILTQSPQFFSESAPVAKANITYVPTSPTTGSYSYGFTRTGTYYFDFPAACVRQYGAVDLPPDQGGTVCEQIQLPLRASGMGEGAYYNTTCFPNPDDPADNFGCICFFDVAETGGGGSGTYRVVSSNEILHTPTAAGFAKSATYCRDGSRLQLTGTDGAYLFDLAGLRTLDLTLVNCADGIQGPGEDGIDCGSACPLTPQCP